MTEKIARGYVRLSGTDSEDSIPTQKNKIREYCKDRDDVTLDKIYNDGKGASGWDSSREEYQQLKQDAEDGEYDVLVVRDGTRIGRDKMERLDMFFDLANKYNVEFHTSSKGYVDPSNPTDLLMEVFEASQADDGKREEIKKAQHQIEKRIEKGMWQGGAPFGTKHGDGPRGLVPTDDFKVLIEIFEAKAEGLSHREAVKKCSKPTISISTVHRMLKNKHRYEVYQEIADEYGYNLPEFSK